MIKNEQNIIQEVEKVDLNLKQILDSMKSITDFSIEPYNNSIDLENNPNFEKVLLTSEQKIHINALLQQLPNMIATDITSKAYVVNFPKGLPHTLTALKQGGFSTIIRNGGKIVGSASLYPMLTQSSIMGVFTALSVITGQFFLSQINTKLCDIDKKIDQLLEFLYNDKQAEIISELTFVKHSYQNYQSIMAHEQQRISTIANLQESKKIALRDIQFYLSDIKSTAETQYKKTEELMKIANKILNIKELLELSKELYVTSSIMEIYYSQNFDQTYLHFVKNNISDYIRKFDAHTSKYLSKVLGHLEAYRIKKGIDKTEEEKKIASIIDTIDSNDEPKLDNCMESVLKDVLEPKVYYLSPYGEIYKQRT